MSPIVLIPARMAASRLPGKPLADIGGVPMVVRVARRALAAGVGPVVVAAADPEIVQVVRHAGCEAVLTDPTLPSGSDRIVQALGELDAGGQFDSVVNLQGDMPFIATEVLAACRDLLEARGVCDIATAVAPESSPADRTNPDVVKAVLAIEKGAPAGRALYFTRSTLYGDSPIRRHIGVYAYRREALARFAAAPISPLERRERLEQLRALEIGLSIWAAAVAAAPISVDSPADLEAARRHARECA
ncbi:MAG: 3-deoxy-manno-octulosonate cytidylyltransferase [Caulobacteraceae bacterium]